MFWVFSIVILFILFCISAAERPRVNPKICSCENGGMCLENELGDLKCDCLPDFSGANCEQSLGHTYAPGSTNTAAIVVPIMVILLVLLAAGGVWYVIRSRPL